MVLICCNSNRKLIEWPICLLAPDEVIGNGPLGLVFEGAGVKVVRIQLAFEDRTLVAQGSQWKNSGINDHQRTPGMKRWSGYFWTHNLPRSLIGKPEQRLGLQEFEQEFGGIWGLQIATSLNALCFACWQKQLLLWPHLSQACWRIMPISLRSQPIIWHCLQNHNRSVTVLTSQLQSPMQKRHTLKEEKS